MTGVADTRITHALYDVIHRRRDVRSEFTGEPVAPDILQRILSAAHAAPSVGLTQPWDFVIITDEKLRNRFRAHVLEERSLFAATLDSDRAERFAQIRIEGIVDAGLAVVVTYDPSRGLPAVIGRHAIDDAGLYSVVLAIQNLWLAATAEGLGVGWVSFYRERFLADLVGLPVHIRPIAWLCVGPVTHLADAPDLERQGWRQRRSLDAAIHWDTWQGVLPP